MIVFSINLGYVFLFPYMSSNFLYYTRYDVWYIVETLDSIIILWRVSIFVLAGVKLTRQTPNSVFHVVGKFQNLCLVQSVPYLLLSFGWVLCMSQDIHHQTRMGRIYIQILRLPLLLWIFSPHFWSTLEALTSILRCLKLITLFLPEFLPIYATLTEKIFQEKSH